MGLRKKPRVKMVVPIRIWGTDSNAQPFNVLAYTLNVSTSGARIGGVKVQLGVGDAVTIQYKQNRALFKVVWVGMPGNPTQDQIGVSLLEQDRQIWAEVQESQTFTDDFAGQRSNRQPVSTSPPPPEPASVPIEVTEAAEDHAASAVDPVQAASHTPPAGFPSPAELATDVDERIRNAARSLLEIDRLVKINPPKPEALHEFREAIAKVRQTVWALQQWHELRDEGRKAFPLLAYLNSERLRFVIHATEDLAKDAATKGVEPDSGLVERFLQAVERLRASTSTSTISEFPGEDSPPDANEEELTQALNHAAREVQSSGMKADAALEYLAREWQRILSAEGVAIAHWHDGEMLCLGSSGNAAEVGMVLETEGGLGGEAMQAAKLVYCANTQSDPRVDAELCAAADIASVVMVPVTQQAGAICGMVEIFSSRRDAFSPAHRNAMRSSTQFLAPILAERTAV